MNVTDPQPSPPGQTTQELIKHIISGNSTKLKMLQPLSKKIDLDDTFNGTTLLGLAIQHNQPCIAKILIHWGASVNKTTSLSTPNNKGHLCNNLYEANEKGHTCTNSDETPLTASLKLNNTKILEILLSHGANIEKPNQMGLSPLWIAATRGNLNGLKQLLHKKAHINFTDFTTNPISILSHFFNNAIIIINSPKDYLVAPKYFNFHASYRDEIIELINAGINHSQPDPNGMDALLWTVKHADFGLTKLLIKAGAKLNPNHPWLQKENLPAEWQARSEIINWIHKKTKNPPSLKRLSCTTTRKVIANSTNFDVRITVDQLEIPQTLKKYLHLAKPTIITNSLKPSTTWSDKTPFLPYPHWPLPLSRWSPSIRTPHNKLNIYTIINNTPIYFPSCPLIYQKLSPLVPIKKI